MTSALRRPHIVEVLPRDGIQTLARGNGSRVPSTADKVRFIRMAAAAGIPEIEVTGFAHPRVIPQLADAERVVRETAGLEGVVLRALVPNFKGALRAVDAGIRKVSALIIASETYQRKNSNMSIADNQREIERIVDLTRRNGLDVHVGIGMCFLCPYEGSLPMEQVLGLVNFFAGLGVLDISIADSIGHAAPTEIASRVDAILQRHPSLKLGLHLHDMSGMALANVHAGWRAGAQGFETCAGGYGGGIAMPVSVEGMGNVPTEDVINLFERMGVDTGVDLTQLCAASRWFSEVIGTRTCSRVVQNGTYQDLLDLGRRSS